MFVLFGCGGGSGDGGISSNDSGGGKVGDSSGSGGGGNVGDLKKLYNRRAGIEPLIGHTKNFGHRKSRPHSDATILASGYRVIMGFNLHQLKKDISKPRLVPSL